jgi:hypothetical protein
VRASLWDISLRVCLKNPERNVLASQFLRTWLCRSHYNLTGRARITRDLPLATHTGRSWSREDLFLLRFLGPRAHAGAHTGWLKVSRLIGFWTPRQCSVQYHLLALLIAYRNDLHPVQYTRDSFPGLRGLSQVKRRMRQGHNEIHSRKSPKLQNN